MKREYNHASFMLPTYFINIQEHLLDNLKK